MNILRSLILTALLSVPLFAANEPASATPAAPVKSSAPAWQESRDAFLSFALDKAKSYSGKAELAVNKAVNVASEEAPKLFHEWIVWRVWYHALHVIIPLVFIVVFLCLAAFGPGHIGDMFETAHGTRKGFATVLCAFACLFWFFSCLVDDPISHRNSEQGHLYSLVQVCAAPRVYTIEQVGRLFGK